MHEPTAMKHMPNQFPEGISISFLTAVFTKTAIEKGYPGGIYGFRTDHPYANSDRRLLAIVSMSSSELQEKLDAIAAKGIDLASCCAVADMFAGPYEGCTGIEFFTTGDSPFTPGWWARTAPVGTWRHRVR